MISIALESPLTVSARALISQSETHMRALFSISECYTFSPEELANSQTDFWVARQGDKALGCVALVRYSNYAEVKRLFVSDAARGFGVARLLMAALEKRAAGLPVIRLETGATLLGAVALYEKLGYHRIAAFGDYVDNKVSLFMEKELP